jgi:uncharacterized membrane protein YccC
MLRSLTAMRPRDVPWRVALRNAAAVVLPLAAGVASGHVEAGVGVAAGALNTMFTDQPGAYRLRMQRMLLTAAAAGLSALAGSLLGAHPLLLVFAGLAWGLGGGLLVALGPDAGRAGLTSMILLVVTAAEPRDPAGALAAAALIFGGGVLQTLFAIAAWPLQRYGPEREALAGLFRQLAASARRRGDSTQPPPQTQALLDVEDLRHGAHRARGPVMESFRVLAELVERIRLELLALGDLQAGLEGEAATTLGRLLEYAARVLDGIAPALERGASPLAASAAMEGFGAVLPALEDLRGHAGEARARRRLAIAVARAQGLGGELRAALRNADFAGSRGELRASAAESRLPRALRPRDATAVLRANLRLSSVAFRHALRCGACLALAIAGERAFGLAHGYWIPMTTAIVLKPDFAGTFRVGLLRVAGTLAGLVLTTLLVHHAFGSDAERLLLLALLCVGFRLTTTIHYGLGVVMLTGLVVILLSFAGVPPGTTMAARGFATVVGSAFALAAYALWPTWEHRRAGPALAGMLDAYRQYFATVMAGDEAARTRARTAARSARTNAQASLDRLRDEPGRDRHLHALASGVFANANRFVRASMALEAARLHQASLPAQAEVLELAARLDARLAELADCLREGKPPRSGSLRRQERALAAVLGASSGADSACDAVADAFDRMTDSLDTLAHLLRQRAAAAGG